METEKEEFFDDKDNQTKIKTTYYDMNGAIIGTLIVSKQESISQLEPEYQPTNAELMEKLRAQEESSLDRDELLLEQQLLLLNIGLNITTM